MLMIKTIVRPNKVDHVKEALGRLNVSGMTVMEVRGHGKQKGHTDVRAIIGAARTGEIGDGRVFVLPVSHSYKIRTGEEEAIQTHLGGPMGAANVDVATLR
jgi:nitrogen regulatory protein PII